MTDPTLGDLLRMISPAPHYTVANMSSILEVVPKRIERALKPLWDEGLLVKTDHDAEPDAETWHFAQGDKTLDAMLARAEALRVDVDLSAQI